jgi:uncharacterized protein YecT (DUF1311 family)
MNSVAGLGAILLFGFSVVGSAQSPLQYQKAANDALASQLQREGKDCRDSRDTTTDNQCIGQAASQTEKDFMTFYQNLKALLDEQARKDLEQAEQDWLSYRKKSCDAINQFFRDGSARFALVTRCEIQLTRSRMKDLDYLYNLPLHH